MAVRASGVLLHPTSLPGSHGVGDLGEPSRDLLEWLHRAGQTVWQILPLGPVGQGSSPYDAQSSFAGDPLLISPVDLHTAGLLSQDEIQAATLEPLGRVDFSAASRAKMQLLRLAFERSRSGDRAQPWQDRVRSWCESPSQACWLEDWTLFAALKDRFDGSWLDWPVGLRDRHSEELRQARQDLAAEIHFHEFVQYLFFEQLHQLRQRAEHLEITLLGDLPFYVALDSSDVWAHPNLFDLDENRRPRTVAGVPPDYFSDTGQRWGNPIYRWDRHLEQGYAWWIDRLSAQLRLVDRLRLDHFRAFAGFWEIPADEPTAIAGRWRQGPGAGFFQTVRESLGGLPFVAEDLGLITPDVDELRQQLQIPGMRVLQFAFDSPESPHLPHNLSSDVVLYTGTHDNDTARGWIGSVDTQLRRRALALVGGTEEDFAWNLVRLAHASIADLVVTPVQDLLGLDGDHRMNTPGTTSGNWDWRLTAGSLTDDLAERLGLLTEMSGRGSRRGAESDS